MTRGFWGPGVSVFGYLGVWVFGCFGVWVFGCFGVQVFGRTERVRGVRSVSRLTDLPQSSKYPNTQTPNSIT
jgi:hypothetical protein